MNSIGQRKPVAEPNPQLVEVAILELLELAQRQGITAADFIQMLDSGMRISDFLNVMDELTDAGHTVDSESVNSRSHVVGSHDS
jgi:hypothetical protein